MLIKWTHVKADIVIPHEYVTKVPHIIYSFMHKYRDVTGICALKDVITLKEIVCVFNSNICVVIVVIEETDLGGNIEFHNLTARSIKETSTGVKATMTSSIYLSDGSCE